MGKIRDRHQLTVVTAGTVLATTSTASAGGIGDSLSPAFDTSCTNHHGIHADGATTHGTGAANGNSAGLPIGNPINQCGGADVPRVEVLDGKLLDLSLPGH